MHTFHATETLNILLDKALRRLRDMARARPVRRLPEAIRVTLDSEIEAARAAMTTSHSVAVVSLLAGTSDARASFDGLVRDIDAAFTSLPSRLSADDKSLLRIKRSVVAALEALARDLRRAR